MQGYRITYRGKIYEGTEFIGHADGSVIELIGNTKEGLASMLIAPAVLCDITRVILTNSSNRSPDDEQPDTE